MSAVQHPLKRGDSGNSPFQKLNVIGRSARSSFRQIVQFGLSLLPMSWSSFTYRQIKGMCRDLGGTTDVQQQVTLRNGGQMLLDIRDSQQRHIFYSRLYEYPYVSCVLRDFVERGDFVVDVGANVGSYTIALAIRVGSNGRVFSFEPNPRSYAFLERNVKLNGFDNVSFYETALAESNGAVLLETRYDDLALSRIVKAGADGEVLRVSSRTMDSLFSDADRARIRFIKIDAEGAEPAILRGATAILEARPNFLLEVDDRRLGAAETSEDELLSFMTTRGYVPFCLSLRGTLVRFDSKSRPIRDNLFFVPREKAFPLRPR